MMHGLLSSRAFRILRILFALLLLALLWRIAGGPDAAKSLASAKPGWLAATFAALILQTVLSAFRWRLTAAQLGIHLGPGDALREYFLGQVVNQSLPGGVLGDAKRALRTREQAGLLAAGQAVLLERLAGQVGLFFCTASTFVLTIALPGGVDWPPSLAIPVGMFIAGGLALPACLYAAIGMPGRFGQGARAFWQVMARALFARRVVVRQIGLSLATAFCNLAAFALCAKAVGHGLSPVAIAAFVPLILLTMLVPLTISGWGLREAAAVALFPVAGVSASGGLAASIVFGIMLMVAALPGLLVLLGRRRDLVATR